MSQLWRMGGREREGGRLAGMICESQAPRAASIKASARSQESLPSSGHGKSLCGGTRSQLGLSGPGATALIPQPPRKDESEDRSDGRGHCRREEGKVIHHSSPFSSIVSDCEAAQMRPTPPSNQRITNASKPASATYRTNRSPAHCPMRSPSPRHALSARSSGVWTMRFVLSPPRVTDLHETEAFRRFLSAFRCSSNAVHSVIPKSFVNGRRSNSKRQIPLKLKAQVKRGTGTGTCPHASPKVRWPGKLPRSTGRGLGHSGRAG